MAYGFYITKSIEETIEPFLFVYETSVGKYKTSLLAMTHDEQARPILRKTKVQGVEYFVRETISHPGKYITGDTKMRTVIEPHKIGYVFHDETAGVGLSDVVAYREKHLPTRISKRGSVSERTKGLTRIAEAH